MRAVVTRVRSAHVAVGEEEVARIGRGLLVLLGVKEGDTAEDARYLARRIADLRIFPDEAGKMNLSLREAGGEVLLVSQFTLYGDVRRGNRPSFHLAAPPDIAEPLYLLVGHELEARDLPVRYGRFGATMAVGSVNDGPVTILIDSERLF